MIAPVAWATLLLDGTGCIHGANAAARKLLRLPPDARYEAERVLLPVDGETIAGAIAAAQHDGRATCRIALEQDAARHPFDCHLQRLDDPSHNGSLIALAVCDAATGAFPARLSDAAAECLDLPAVDRILAVLEPVCGAFGLQPLLAIADDATGRLRWADTTSTFPLPSLRSLAQVAANSKPDPCCATLARSTITPPVDHPLHQWLDRYIVLPLTARGQRRGILALTGPGVGAIDVAALRPLGYLLGTAVEQARERGLSAGITDRMALLWQASQAISGVTQLDDVLRVSCEQAQQLASATTAAILLLEDDCYHLRCVMAVGAYSDLLLGHRTNVQASITGQALQQRGTLVVGTIEDHARLDPIIRQSTQLRSGMYQVLHIRGRQIGVLAVAHEREHFFNEGQQAVLEQWSASVAVAIENAQLHDTVRRSEERYRTLFQNALEIVLTLDVQGQIISLNRAALQFFGISPAEGQHSARLHDLLSPEAAAHLLQLQSLVLHGESLPPTEVILHRPDGSRAFVEVTLRLLQEDGQTSGVYIIGRDVTDRHRQRRVLSDQIEQLTALHTLSAALNSSLQRDRMLQAAVEAIAIANQFACVAVYLPEPSNQFLQLTASTGLDNATRDHVREVRDGSICWNVLQSGAIAIRSTADLRGDLRSSFEAMGVVSHAFLPIATASNALGVLAIGRANDAVFSAAETQVLQTMAAQIAQALEKIDLYGAAQLSAARYRDLYENANDFIGTLAPDGRVLSLNRAALQFFGYAPAEVVDLHLRDMLPAHGEQHVADVLRSLQNSHSSNIDQLQVVRRDGSAALLELRSRLVYEHQTPVAIHFIARDITERTQLEVQMRQTEKLAALGQLVAGAAHELNNPLAVVLGTAQLLQRDPRVSPFAEDIANIEQAAQRARHIVKQLLMFARKQDQARAPVDVGPLFDRVLSILKEQLQHEQIDVVNRLPPDLSPVWGDTYQLEQVFDNLLHNAIHALSESSRRPRTIVIEAVSHADRVRIKVADNGPGIAPDTLPRIFDPFFTTKDVGRGTGLGLSIVYGIVEQHGGAIQAESVPGNGATFVIDLPISREVASAGSPVVTGRSTNSTILVVEDEADVRMVVQRALMQHGYAVDTVASAELASQRLTDRAYDLVISDLKMPGVSGKELYDRVHPTQPQLNWVFITGDTMSETNAGFLGQSGVPVLAKPFSLEELWDAVATSMLNNQHAQPTAV